MSVVSVLTEGEFRERMEQCGLEGKWTLINFSAKWCEECHKAKRRYRKYAEKKENRNICFVKVDVDDMPVLAADYKVSSMPGFVVFWRGRQVTDLPPFTKKVSSENFVKYELLHIIQSIHQREREWREQAEMERADHYEPPPPPQSNLN